mmetsp:Transcript_123629/g.283466  ORF Transcript_123629/g.283466 Transcript_123629/m.283466 type:complete len:227 (+) Transcript_123629:916-1596(+)
MRGPLASKAPSECFCASPAAPLGPGLPGRSGSGPGSWAPLRVCMLTNSSRVLSKVLPSLPELLVPLSPPFFSYLISIRCFLSHAAHGTPSFSRGVASPPAAPAAAGASVWGAARGRRSAGLSSASPKRGPHTGGPGVLGRRPAGSGGGPELKPGIAWGGSIFQTRPCNCLLLRRHATPFPVRQLQSDLCVPAWCWGDAPLESEGTEDADSCFCEAAGSVVEERPGG